MNTKDATNDTTSDNIANKMAKPNINNSESYSHPHFSTSVLPLIILKTASALNIVGSLLATIAVKIGSLQVRAFLDSGNQYNFITERSQEKLNLPESHNQSYAIQAIGGSIMNQQKRATFATIHSIHPSFKIFLDGPNYHQNKITDYIPHTYFSIESWNIPLAQFW